MIMLIDEPAQKPIEDQLEWWQSVARTGDGPLIFIQSRLHEADEMGHILGISDWDVLKL